MGEQEVQDLEAEDFLELVYGEREGWVDLPAKVGKYWVPFHTEWPDDSAVTRRIDSSLRDGEDLYYSVAQFSQRGRNIEHVLPSHWLWADLDEVHPTEGARIGFLPTVAVQSSPGRYQALWRLTRALRPKNLERLNRGLSYCLEADRGGWDLTQVLRIPGTRNFKYPDAPVVELMWYKPDLVYDPKAVWAAVKEHVPAAELASVEGTVLPRRPIPKRARLMLKAGPDEVVEGERSARLWELNCILAESGLTDTEIYALVSGTPWNKWRGISSGRARLSRDIAKAIQHVNRRAALEERERHAVEKGDAKRAEQRGRDEADDSDAGEEVSDLAPSDEGTDTSLPWVGYSSFMAMAMEEPKWLIEDIWTAGSHGIIGGEPKTSKTTLACALALAVASGEPFLGQYSVGTSGPVLFVQEETAPWRIQDIMRKTAAMMGLISKDAVHVSRTGEGALGEVSIDLDFPLDLPLRLLNNFGYDLSVEEHREMLEAEVSETRPALVILDPMYLILGDADENRSFELRPYLKWLMQLRYEYDCAIALIHHFRKQQGGPNVVRSRPGQRLMGSGTLHGWVDAAMYLEAMDDDRPGWTKVKLEREFRSMAPQRGLEIALHMGGVGDLHMEVEVEKYDLLAVIRNMVRDEPGVTIAAIAEKLGMDKRTALARVRGAEGAPFRIEGGKKGRGHTWQVYLAE